MGYYTHWQDANLPLLQLGVRFYDSEIGRFTQVDPIRDGMNWYAYVDGRPLHYVDPDGTTPTLIPVVAGMSAVAYICLDKALQRAIEIRQSNYDKVAHCYMACMAQLCTGGELGCLTGRLKAWLITWFMESQDGTDDGDYESNKIGAYICASPIGKVLKGMSPFAGCEACCRRLTKGKNDAERMR